MAKTNGPLLSLGGNGQIAKTQVYSKWKGVPYVRQYVIPANPQSTEQTKTRSVFSWLAAVYKLAGADLTAPWQAFVKGKPLTPVNAFQSKNIPVLRTPVVNDAMVFSPGAGGGVPASSFALADGGTHHITVTMGVPAVPAGWTVTDSIAVAIVQQDPHGTTDYTTYAAASGDGSGNVSILAKAGTFVVGGWFKFTKDDGTFAYGPSLSSTQVIA